MVSYRLCEFEVLPSTNTYALEHLEALVDGTVIWARVQTAGRGRLTRGWLSDVPGNIYTSLVLKPPWRREPPLPLASLTQYLSLVLCQKLDDYGVFATIKWPNDVQIAGKKIAGILAELRLARPEVPSVVLGMGVNLNLDPATLERIDQPTTALNLVLSSPVDDRVFLHQLLAAFFSGYHRFLEHGFAGLRSEYLKRCLFLGQELTVRQPTGLLRGIATTVNHQGALELWSDDGMRHVLLAGDTSNADS